MFPTGLIANLFLNTMGDLEKVTFDKVRDQPLTRVIGSG